MGDTKSGTYVGADSYGNKYYENMAEELPCMTTPRPYLHFAYCA